MIQRDYIQRMIQQFAELTAKLLHLPLAQRIETVGAAFEQYAALSLPDALALSPEDLLTALTGQRQLDWTRVEFLGKLLSKAGELSLQQQNPERAHRLFERALACLDYADTESGMYDPERLALIEDVRARVG